MPTIPLTALPMVFQVSAALLATPCVALIVAYLMMRLRGAPAPTPGVTDSVSNPDAILQPGIGFTFIIVVAACAAIALVVSAQIV